MSKKLILGIETSCDDTSICLLSGETGEKPEILALKAFSQEALLSSWGGVVPEIAARNHVDKIPPLIKSVIEESAVKIEQIDLFSVTAHPGLVGPLLTGINLAKSLSLYFKKPIYPANHLFAHLEAIHIDRSVPYPYLGVLVSGGHTLFAIVESPANWQIVGQTIDDAAGEAFDKGGKLMGLGYPAGRIIDELAKFGDKDSFAFPIGLKHSGKADMSYSGVKTSLRTTLLKHRDQIEKFNLNEKGLDQYPDLLKNLCASYQHSIVSALVYKLKKAIQIEGLKQLPIVVGGGVACNSYLRSEFQTEFKNVEFVTPKYCTDNGAMVANLAFRDFNNAIEFPQCLTIDAKSRYIEKKRSN